MKQELVQLIKNIRGRTKAGSSIANATLYHDLPFEGFSGIRSHRKNTLKRFNFIKDKTGIDFNNKKVIDIGCSVGGMSLCAANHGASVEGYDYDDQSIDVAKYAAKELELDAKFFIKVINKDFCKSLVNYNIGMWLSQWMWIVKQYGMGTALDMLYDVSKACDVLIFQSAANDGMAAIKGYTQKDIYNVVKYNTVYSDIIDIGYLPEWNNRNVYFCKDKVSDFDGYTAKVKRIDRTTVRKIYKNKFGWMKDREVKALNIMNDSGFTPKIKDIGANHIDMTYCGINEKITNKYNDSLNNMVVMLKQNGVVHRDINPKNLLIHNGELKLIDFGWCLFDNETETPVEAPKALGGKWYVNNRNDDSAAIDIICKDA